MADKKEKKTKMPNMGRWLAFAIIGGFAVGFGVCFITFKMLGGN